jgi:hypothetical protein
LVRLLGITEGPEPGQLRTVSLRDALGRARTFVKPSKVARKDLLTLVDMRDGTVHAAENAEVEERLVVAFVEQAEEFLDDLGRDRSAFWGLHAEVVDALLADASNKVTYRVQLKLAAARANLERRYGGESAEVLNVVAKLARPTGLGVSHETAECPACEYTGIAAGDHDVEWDYDREGDLFPAVPAVWFTADGFACRVCGLRLDSTAELEAAEMSSRWEVEDADPWQFMQVHHDDDEQYEAWREGLRLGREE